MRVPIPDYSVLDGVCLLLYANKLDLDQGSPLDVNEVHPTASVRVHTALRNREAGRLMLWWAVVDR